jgi:sterol desaturase/sphingolipid hydroxylase (fatty acid hydroxylase superfamily)
MTIRVDSFIHSLSHSSSLSPPLPTRNNPPPRWVHRHHHQQTYPCRPALDTLNTGAIEAAVGSYLQLAVLWACGSLLGVVHVPAALAFFEIAGWLSVLEHDRFVRELPFGLWKVEEHHMHHAFVKCNYGR